MRRPELLSHFFVMDGVQTHESGVLLGMTASAHGQDIPSLNWSYPIQRPLCDVEQPLKLEAKTCVSVCVCVCLGLKRAARITGSQGFLDLDELPTFPPFWFPAAMISAMRRSGWIMALSEAREKVHTFSLDGEFVGEKTEHTLACVLALDCVGRCLLLDDCRLDVVARWDRSRAASHIAKFVSNLPCSLWITIIHHPIRTSSRLSKQTADQPITFHS